MLFPNIVQKCSSEHQEESKSQNFPGAYNAPQIPQLIANSLRSFELSLASLGASPTLNKFLATPLSDRQHDKGWILFIYHKFTLIKSSHC